MDERIYLSIVREAKKKNYVNDYCRFGIIILQKESTTGNGTSMHGVIIYFSKTMWDVQKQKKT